MHAHDLTLKRKNEAGTPVRERKEKDELRERGRGKGRQMTFKAQR